MSKMDNTFAWGRYRDKPIPQKPIVAGRNIAVIETDIDLTISTTNALKALEVVFDNNMNLVDNEGVINVRDVYNLLSEVVVELSKYKPWNYIGVWVAGTIAQKNQVFTYLDALYLSLKDDNLEIPSNDKINWLLINNSAPIDLDNYYTKAEVDNQFLHYESNIITTINEVFGKVKKTILVKRYSPGVVFMLVNKTKFLEDMGKLVLADGSTIPREGYDYTFDVPRGASFTQGFLDFNKSGSGIAKIYYASDVGYRISFQVMLVEIYNNIYEKVEVVI